MAGALYIWLIGACFLIAALIAGTLIGLLWLGHWYEKKQLGAKGGFMEHVPYETPPTEAPQSHGDKEEREKGS